MEVIDPQVGDWAHAKFSELDPRRVVKIETTAIGTFVYLELAGASMGPFAASRYTYTRERES